MLVAGTAVFTEKINALRSWIDYEADQQKHRSVESLIQFDAVTSQ